MAADSTTLSMLRRSVTENDTKALNFIEEMTKNCDSVQENVLREILTQNAEAEYVKKWNLGDASDRKTFKSNVPVVSYEDIEPYIYRIVNGDRSSVLSSHPISGFLTRLLHAWVLILKFNFKVY